MPILSFGKHAGMDLKDVPRGYVEWLRDARRKDLKDYQDELERRDLAESADISMVERLVQEGFRALSKKMHPDAGGTDGEFRELMAAKEQLKAIVDALGKMEEGS